MQALLDSKEQDGCELLKKYKHVEELEEQPLYFVDTKWFALLIGFAICLSSLMIGLDVDYAPVTSQISEKLEWFAVDLLFTLIFVIEMLAKQYFYRWTYFASHANKFDFALVLLAVFDNILTASSAGAGVGKLRMLRMARLLRLARLIRLVSMFKELWLVVSGLVESLRAILWASVMLFLLIYVCAILVTLTIGRNDEYDNYNKISGGWDHRKFFGTLPRSMLTMLQIVTLENWSDSIVRHVLSNQPGLTLFFIVFIFMTSFGLLNLVVGIIVDNTLAAARRNSNNQKKKKEGAQLQVLASLREVFNRADIDGSGTIDSDEFESILLQKKIQNQFRVIGIPVGEANELFDILDVDGSGVLSIDEFFGGCFKLKGLARSKDLLSVQAAVESLWSRMGALESSLSKEEKLVEEMDYMSARMVRNYSEMLAQNASGPGKEQFRKQIPGTFLPTIPGFL